MSLSPMVNVTNNVAAPQPNPAVNTHFLTRFPVGRNSPKLADIAKTGGWDKIKRRVPFLKSKVSSGYPGRIVCPEGFIVVRTASSLIDVVLGSDLDEYTQLLDPSSRPGYRNKGAYQTRSLHSQHADLGKGTSLLGTVPLRRGARYCAWRCWHVQRCWWIQKDIQFMGGCRRFEARKYVLHPSKNECHYS